MKSISIVVTGLAAALAAAQLNNAAFKADIRVDTNRDGVVDIEGSSDQQGKNEWTDASGAIFLANIGDSGERCRKLHPETSLRKLADILGTLAKCHDADDDEQRAPGNLAPMRTMPIQGLSNSATASVSVSDTKARSLVRIFRAGKDDSWEIVNNDTVFSAQELQQGLTLGIDARDTRRADGWDGRVTVDFTVKDGEVVSKDSVMLRVAPVLLHHHRQPIQKVFTSDFATLPRIMQDYMQSVPANTDRGWAIMAIDPQMGLELLRTAEERGFGGEPVINPKVASSGPTISGFLKESSNIEAAEKSGRIMEANLEILKKETGITDDEIFQVPALIGLRTVVKGYTEPSRRRSIKSRGEAEEAALDAKLLENFDSHEPEGDSRNETAIAQRHQARAPAADALESLLPSLVNGLPLSESHYLAPKPFGPTIHGRDMFEITAAAAYKKAGFSTVDFLDEWRIHQASGDLHCLSNTFRDTSTPWWSQ